MIVNLFFPKKIAISSMGKIKAIVEKKFNVKKKENVSYILPSFIALPGNEPCENLDADESRISF